MKSNNMKIHLFKCGYCSNCEKMTLKTGTYKSVKFPALVVLIDHPTHGYILFDTGYSPKFIEETKKFPYSIYAKVTPVHIDETTTILSHLKDLGIHAEDINYILLSHFHADHISGCTYFPTAKFICSKDGYDYLKNKSGIRAVKEAFIPKLLPENFSTRTVFIEDQSLDKISLGLNIFPYGYDLFQDGSLFAVDLSGHAKGHYGLYVKNGESEYFFIGDACWVSENYTELIFPHKLANTIMYNSTAFYDILKKLHEVSKMNPSLKIIPSHCEKAIDKELAELK